MRFSDIVKQAVALLHESQRVTYRALKREFALDDEALEDLTEELIIARRVAVDEDGKVLVWTGDGAATTAPSSASQPPASYTPSHLAERILAEHAAMEARGAADGERKTITALFADLKGSTALIEWLDPEDARAIIDPALQLMMDAVHRYEGYVAQALGDGIFALFGAPIAHEDHPQRALYAALRMQDGMRHYSDDLRRQGRTPLHMRVGINTGEVVVRSIRKDDLHTDYVPVGHSTNLAARMEQLANPGSIVVTPDTYKLTNGYFEFRTLGETLVKGVEEPLNIYEVVGAGPLRTKLKVAARRGLSRFVGRYREMEQLQHALTQAQEGHGQIVGVMGEPGVGKSRLFYEFVGAVREPSPRSQTDYLVLEAFAVSHGRASVYLSILELLKSYFEITLEDDERKRREKITGKVLALDRSLEDTLPYLFYLLGITDPTSSLQQMDAQIRRRRTFETLKKLFLRESLNQPLILIFEDLHWIDAETQGFLDSLCESVASACLLLLVNYRPEYRHDWGNKTYYRQLQLAPLGKAEAEELLAFLLGSDVSLTPLKALILEKTEGTLFFIEEVVQELVEQGRLVRTDVGAVLCDRPLQGAHVGAPLQIPPTVQGVLAARIDRLGADEKALLQQLSVIGREFPLGLISKVVPQPEEALYRLLSALQAKEFLYEQPAFPEVEYIFKHALTQDVAYGSVLQQQRRVLHARTAGAIEDLYQSSLDEHYAELAHHYTRSGNTEKAVQYLQLAGQQAVQRSANNEAVSHLTAALELLQTLPDTSERSQQELVLQTSLGPAFIATKGYGSAEVEHAYFRARELCRQVGETPQLYPALLGVWVSHLMQAKLQTARELGEQLLRLAQQTHDSSLLVGGYWAVGETLLMLGELTACRDHLERGIALYGPEARRDQAYLYGEDHGMTCLSFVAMGLWLLGYPDRALVRSREAVTVALARPHLNTQAFAWTISLWVYEFCRDPKTVQERAQTLLSLAAEIGGVLWQAFGTFRIWNPITSRSLIRLSIRLGLSGAMLAPSSLS